MRKRAVVAGLAVGACAAGAAFIAHALASEPVTDEEARAFARSLDDALGEQLGAVCESAKYRSRCLQDVQQYADEATPTQPARIVCTWHLAGEEGARVVELENFDAKGNPFRASVAVWRDGDRLVGWPVPYWGRGTRALPSDGSSGAAGPAGDLAAQAIGDNDVGFTHDPCAP